MTNLIGQSIGRYHVLEQLGEGGMATVYKARDTVLDRDIAFKVIRADAFGAAALQDISARFQREARVLAKLSHPNIVPILDYGEYAGAPYLIMPYISGGTLKQFLTKPLPYLESARLLIPIAQALSYAHQQGILHRDIKPANILIMRAGAPLLSDFGIARILDGETRSLTSTGVGIGTPEYMAPEQGMGQADERSDVYALGIVFYEMVTGRIPFQADTPMAVLLKKMQEPLPRPKSFIAALPDAVENVLVKALARDPNQRYPDMLSFARALEDLVGVKEPATNILTGETLSDETRSPIETKGRANQVIYWAAAVFGIFLCCVVFIGGTIATRLAFPAPAFTPTWTPAWTPMIFSPMPETAATLPAPTSVMPPTSVVLPTAMPAFTAIPIPRMFGFEICLLPCNGNNARQSLPDGTTKIYVKWRYENIPPAASYVRVWNQETRGEWVRYECTWPNASSGIEDVTLTEPAGLHSGKWSVTIYINGQILLQESVSVEGSSTYWDPAGTFHSCYGKR